MGTRSKQVSLTEYAKQKRTRWATYLTDEAIEQIRRAAYHLRMTTGEVVEAAVSVFVEKQEKKQGRLFGPVKRLTPGRRLKGE
jgi:hypothetical protein